MIRERLVTVKSLLLPYGIRNQNTGLAGGIFSFRGILLAERIKKILKEYNKNTSIFENIFSQGKNE